MQICLNCYQSEAVNIYISFRNEFDVVAKNVITQDQCFLLLLLKY